MSRLAPKLEDALESAEVELLDDNLYAFNVRATGISDGRGLACVVRGGDSRLLAALSGHTWGATCEIQRLWVDEKLRRQGIGLRLLRGAEREARARGCRQILVASHSFQAPAFYVQQGFEILFETPDYPRGHSLVHLRKELAPGDASG